MFSILLPPLPILSRVATKQEEGTDLSPPQDHPEVDIDILGLLITPGRIAGVMHYIGAQIPPLLKELFLELNLQIDKSTHKFVSIFCINLFNSNLFYIENSKTNGNSLATSNSNLFVFKNGWTSSSNVNEVKGITGN